MAQCVPPEMQALLWPGSLHWRGPRSHAPAPPLGFHPLQHLACWMRWELVPAGREVVPAAGVAAEVAGGGGAMAGGFVSTQ